MKIIYFQIVAIVALSIFVTNVAYASGDKIRVLVTDERNEVEIRGSSAGRYIKIEARPSGLYAKGRNKGERMVLRCKRFCVIDSRSFRDKLDVSMLDGKIMVVNTLPIEDYLGGIINSEISTNWPKETIKAQAVAARTYALYQIKQAEKVGRNYDIKSTTMDQVYNGAHEEDSQAKRLVRATRGEVMKRDGEVFSAYYHSVCGGHTEHAHNVWSGEEGPPVIDDPYCVRSPKFSWDFQISITQFLQTLRENGVVVDTLRTIVTGALPDSPRVGEVLIEDDNGIKMVKAIELRRMFGYQNIKSTWFDVTINGSNLIFKGKGYGHGVGLCQWGSKAMGEKSKYYKEILKFYYPDAGVERMW